MTNQTILLNPYSISLGKNPYMTIQTKPIHVDGNFKVYRYCDEYFIHTFKNIVVAERCGVNKQLITNLQGVTIPSGANELYFDYERPKAAMQKGIEEANKLNFSIQ